MLYNWAVEHPDLCRAIAGIYPVVNLNTWPPDLTPAAAAYGLAVEEFRRRLAEFNPIDRLAALAKARVPVFHIHGDNDVPVPLDANSGELVRRYRALGGSAALVTVKGRGHEEVDEYFKSEALRDFIVRCAHDGSAERDRPDQEDG
jgi:pimeloyl-ACP methyl ester carboxylesterase